MNGGGTGTYSYPFSENILRNLLIRTLIKHTLKNFTYNNKIEINTESP